MRIRACIQYNRSTPPKKTTGVWARTNKNKQTNTFSTIMNLSTYRVCLSYFRSIHDKTSDSYDTVL